jgi:hypothetical protein
MKKLLFLFALLPFLCSSQITVTGFTTYIQTNQTYALDANYPSFFIAQNFIQKDAGTNSYLYTNINTNEKFWIVRKQGFWQIEKIDANGSAIYLLYRIGTTTTNIEPTCNATWQVWTGYQFEYGDYRSNTGQTETPILQSNSCGCATILGTTLDPKFLQLPLLSSNNISAIPIVQPMKGKVTYNSCLNIPVAYNGTSWDTFIMNKNGNVNLNGSLNMPVSSNLNSANTSFQLGVNQNTFIHRTATNITLTIPTAQSAEGRHYFITNHGTGVITVNFAIRTSSTSITSAIPSNAHFHIVSDGFEWHMIN